MTQKQVVKKSYRVFCPTCQKRRRFYVTSAEQVKIHTDIGEVCYQRFEAECRMCGEQILNVSLYPESAKEAINAT